MQDLSETLELIRLSIYISFVITCGTVLYFIGLIVWRIYRIFRLRRFNDQCERNSNRLTESRTFNHEEMLRVLCKKAKIEFLETHENDLDL